MSFKCNGYGLKAEEGFCMTVEVWNSLQKGSMNADSLWVVGEIYEVVKKQVCFLISK